MDLDFTKPALLVSYYYLESWHSVQKQLAYRHWVMDSGAYSAHNSGVEINLQRYIRACQMLKATDTTLREVFALDVIGDWQASLWNTQAMWRAGVQAIPCFHYGEPFDLLDRLARDYPKIALGGAVGKPGKLEWARECFRRVYPKRIHGFGFGSKTACEALPWHSVDAMNWAVGPLSFGNSKTFGKRHRFPRRTYNLQGEVRHYLNLEAKTRAQWAKETEFTYYLGYTPMEAMPATLGK